VKIGPTEGLKHIDQNVLEAGDPCGRSSDPVHREGFLHDDRFIRVNRTFKPEFNPAGGLVPVPGTDQGGYLAVLPLDRDIRDGFEKLRQVHSVISSRF
jgi:hypothetical protein